MIERKNTDIFNYDFSVYDFIVKSVKYPSLSVK